MLSPFGDSIKLSDGADCDKTSPPLITEDGPVVSITKFVSIGALGSIGAGVGVFAGICFTGNFDIETPSQKQLES